MPLEQGPYSCCLGRMIWLMGPVAGGAARLVACAADEDAGPVADDKTEGPAARGGDGALRALAHYRLWLQTSSPGVLPLPEPPDGLWS